MSNTDLPPSTEVILGNPYAQRQRTARPTLTAVVVAEAVSEKGNKYGAKRTWSEACQRTFDSRAEARRGEELHLLQLAGQISGLEYQPKWWLCVDAGHRASYTADFKYVENGMTTVEDVKGMMTEAARVRMAWLWQLYGIDVKVVKA